MTTKKQTLGPNQKAMQSFTVKSLPNLDTVVLAALELFSNKATKLSKLKIPYKRPLVVGSGNAIATGKIIFEKHDARYAPESTVEAKLKSIKAIDGVVLFSASGAKHAPIIAKLAKKYKKPVTLITNTKNSDALKILNLKSQDQEYIFPKNREPYTYNTSTYMGPIISYTKEDPKSILKFIKNNITSSKITKLKPNNLKKYKKFYIQVPEEFEGIIRLLNVKFIELFGRQFSRDIETFQNTKHATTVVPSKKELFISFGQKNKTYGQKEHRLHIPLPKQANYAAMMAIAYYVIGQIQKAHPPYFKKNIQNYMKETSKIFNKKMSSIVE